MDASLYRNASKPGPPLRVGLLLDGPVLPRCSAEVIDHIRASDFARLALVVYNGDAEAAPGARKPRSLARKAIDTLRDPRRRRSLLFTLYQRWDRRNVDPATDPLAPVDCRERLRGVEAMRVTPFASHAVHRFPDEAVARIRERKLDVIIRFGFNILHGDILRAARCGVWSYHHGDNDFYRGGPACFWEVLEDNPLSGVTLQALTEELDAGLVLCKGQFATERGFSVARNRVQPYWGAATFVIQKLRELYVHGWEHVRGQALAPRAYQGRKKIYSRPSNAEMLAWLVPLLATKAVARLMRRPMVRHWQIGIRAGARPLAEALSPPDMSGFTWVESPHGHFYADPFLVQSEGQCWMFFEDYDYVADRGVIACAQLHENGLGPAVVVLDKPYHLSYPCVFRDGDAWFMVPESSAAGTVELYRCTRFPDQWQFERELAKCLAVDTTVWVEDGVYWFFVTYAEPHGGAYQLWLYSAPSLEAPWEPHPANPVSTDVRYARCGGAIFRHAGKLFRPSQDCSGEYGRRLVLNEITALDRQAYREEPRVVVAPGWLRGLTGTHTYARAGAFEVVDAKHSVRAERRHGALEPKGLEEKGWLRHDSAVT